jgi:hypothetical protein
LTFFFVDLLCTVLQKLCMSSVRTVDSVHISCAYCEQVQYNYYSTLLSDVHLAESLGCVRRHNMEGNWKKMKWELSFPQTTTSFSHMDGRWNVCNIRQPFPAHITLMYLIQNLSSFSKFTAHHHLLGKHSNIFYKPHKNFIQGVWVSLVSCKTNT